MVSEVTVAFEVNLFNFLLTFIYYIIKKNMNHLNLHRKDQPFLFQTIIRMVHLHVGAKVIYVAVM